ncbi:hypothetical protein [Candidatus Pelagibacter sp. HIMB1495]|uniref:hypothetical protein n=1 Tax=unclassified Candidatus Pelagibacter TaxID=2647897 RepID=UPI003F86C682
MDLKFKLNAKEYATLEGITASALRKRRLSGKLEGQFIKKGSEYFYSTPLQDRPNKGTFTAENSRSKIRRRNVPDASTNYHKARNGHQLKLTNDLRQLARINRRLNEEQIAEITDDIFEVAKQRRRDRIKKQELEHSKKLNKSNYGGFNSGSIIDVRTNWRPLFPEPRTEYDEVETEPATTKYY